jgi:hypothetical protein
MGNEMGELQLKFLPPATRIALPLLRIRMRPIGIIGFN